jgi:hypothetical protein
MCRCAIITGLTAILAFNNANADEGTCVELAKTIGINYASYLNIDERRAIAKADMCSENYSGASRSRQAQIEASYRLFEGAASGSDNEITQSQSKYCEGKFGDYWRNQIRTGQAQTISSEGASVINTCLLMNSDFLFPTLVIANAGQEITMAVQYKPTVVAEIKVAQFGPSDLKENSCTVTRENALIDVTQPSDVAQTLKPLGSITTNCKRALASTQIDGVTYQCTKETIFVVATSGPVRAIKIPRVCSETIQESRADRIEKKADSALEQAEVAKRMVAALKDGTNAVLAQLRALDDPSRALGFDINDSSFNAGRRQFKECGDGQFLARVETYYEDGHIKMAFHCKALKSLQVP